MNLPKFPKTSTNERIGVLRVATLLTEMGFIFRETSNSDTGIDGYIEEVNNNREATGRLLAVQIKSGSSYLYDDDNDNFVFYADKSHIRYWKLYPIPVILCVHNPNTDKTYYQTILSCGNDTSTKIKIPKVQVLSYENRDGILASIAGFSSTYHSTEELYTIMSSKRILTFNNYVSFLDLFVGGLTNLCTDLFCDISVLSNLIDLRTNQPFYIINNQVHDFLWEFIKFITKENLAKVNFESCLYDWEYKMMVPRILVPLTYRGVELLNEIENKHPGTVLDCSVSISTDYDWDERMKKLMLPT